MSLPTRSRRPRRAALDVAAWPSRRTSSRSWASTRRGGPVRCSSSSTATGSGSTEPPCTAPSSGLVVRSASNLRGHCRSSPRTGTARRSLGRSEAPMSHDMLHGDSATRLRNVILAGRGTRIRTGGLPLPKRTRYQAAPHPAAGVAPGTVPGYRRAGSPPRRRRSRRSPPPAPVRLASSSGRTLCRLRGCSSMAEPQPSKLVMRVRSPSPAPHHHRRSHA